jgi:hypothetical protein
VDPHHDAALLMLGTIAHHRHLACAFPMANLSHWMRSVSSEEKYREMVRASDDIFVRLAFTLLLLLVHGLCCVLGRT